MKNVVYGFLFFLPILLTACSQEQNEIVIPKVNMEGSTMAKLKIGEKMFTGGTNTGKIINKSGYQGYENKELGISLMYPERLGAITELKYKDYVLLGLRFSATEHPGIDSTQGLEGNNQIMRTCEDFLKNGFLDGDIIPSSCETIIVDGHAMRIVLVEAGGRSNSGRNASNTIFFDTKVGVWTMRGDIKEITEIAKSIKYIK